MVTLPDDRRSRRRSADRERIRRPRRRIPCLFCSSLEPTIGRGEHKRTGAVKESHA